jgi:hypothetical protein
MITGGSQVNLGHLERSTTNERERVRQRTATCATYRVSATSASNCCSRDPPSAPSRWVVPFTAEDLRSYTASLSVSPCSLRESSSTRCSRCVLLVSALTSDMRVSCRSRVFRGKISANDGDSLLIKYTWISIVLRNSLTSTSRCKVTRRTFWRSSLSW